MEHLKHILIFALSFSLIVLIGRKSTKFIVEKDGVKTVDRKLYLLAGILALFITLIFHKVYKKNPGTKIGVNQFSPESYIDEYKSYVKGGSKKEFSPGESSMGEMYSPGGYSPGRSSFYAPENDYELESSPVDEYKSYIKNSSGTRFF